MTHSMIAASLLRLSFCKTTNGMARPISTMMKISLTQNEAARTRCSRYPAIELAACR